MNNTKPSVVIELRYYIFSILIIFLRGIKWQKLQNHYIVWILFTFS